MMCLSFNKSLFHIKKTKNMRELRLRVKHEPVCVLTGRKLVGMIISDAWEDHEEHMSSAISDI